ncbi:MAG: putative 4-hydroxy-4-methyl-2-oxoglutarate aldolase [Gammaproteobacteria bacterium]|nr:putative 4-hydroxy-4-methyl-2-oxoglutarate aldolase [Gammaproteobacteria bacterium]
MQDLLPELCDQFEDLVHVVEPMLMNFGAKERFSGEIVTLKCHEDNSKVRELAGQDGTGKVLVVDGGGSLRRALLGDLLAEKAASNGWEGMVIYGCIRDVNAIGGINLGVQALAAHPMKTEKRGLGDINQKVHFGGVTFTPGHFIYADNNGVLVAPHALVLKPNT